jgi:hypothetical protein
MLTDDDLGNFSQSLQSCVVELSGFQDCGMNGNGDGRRNGEI